MTKNSKNSQSGFMLLEIVAGIAIIGLVVLTINNIPQSIKLIGQSKRETIAQQIATGAIEDLRAKTYANLTDTSSPLPISDSRISQLPSGSATYQIKDCPGITDPHPVCTSSPSEKTKYIIATVTWNEDGRTLTVELDTLVSDGGLQ